MSDEDILMTDHVHYRHLQVANVNNQHSDWNGDDRPNSVHSNLNASDRVRFYMLNLEHGQSQANFEVVNSSFVDVYGIKLEGSTTIMWVRDSHDVNLW